MLERARRRRFSAEYKLEVLAAALDGEKGVVLRREGLYSSHIEGDPSCGPVDLFPCCWSTVVRVEGTVIIRRSHAPSVFVVGAPANSFPAAGG